MPRTSQEQLLERSNSYVQICAVQVSEGTVVGMNAMVFGLWVRSYRRPPKWEFVKTSDMFWWVPILHITKAFCYFGVYTEGPPI